MNYVYSTLANAQSYTNYTIRGGNDLPVKIRTVHIAGGANVIGSKTLKTPLGVVTSVTDEDLAFLMQNEIFKQHKAAGFITVKPYNIDPEKVAPDMMSRDESAQIVPQDYEDGGKIKAPTQTAAASA